MTFNPSVPLSSDSPSIFPPQNQGNMTRLQTLFSADHQFNLTAAANDGYHNLIHMTIQAPTGALPSTGRLYVKVVSGVVQLFYMDSAGVEYQVTPESDTSPIKITGSAFLASNGQADVLNVAYNYTGFGFAYADGTVNQSTYNFLRIGANTDIHTLDSNQNVPPSLSFTGTVLRIKNNGLLSKTCDWSLIINRVP